MEVSLYQKVQYIGTAVPEDTLLPGDVGWVVEIYNSEWCEVDFWSNDTQTGKTLAVRIVDIDPFCSSSPPN
jgi:Domain of unknown function (DUF4926)